mmetsp:Transcript_5326/g.6963  ORF Transcript_5326/g.6963 Transcript_5326/m.6963 type:complete len:109 (-) Transcript_5326:25-351(-)
MADENTSSLDQTPQLQIPCASADEMALAFFWVEISLNDTTSEKVNSSSFCRGNHRLPFQSLLLVQFSFWCGDNCLNCLTIGESRTWRPPMVFLICSIFGNKNATRDNR